MANTDWDDGFFTWTCEAHIVVDASGTVVGWNPSAADILQISTVEALGQQWGVLVPDLASLLPSDCRVGPPNPQRRRATRRDGTPLVVDAMVGWHAESWRIILADQRKFAAIEATAYALQQCMLHLLDAFPVVVATISLRDDEFTVLYQNARGVEVYGWANDEWDRDPDFTLKILHPDDRERMTAFFGDVRAAKAS